MTNYEDLLDGAHLRLLQIKAKRDQLEELAERMSGEEQEESAIFLSYIIMKGIAEDLEEFLDLIKSDSKARYQDFIIRNITEQTIEYMYLMNNKELIAEYFGSEARIEEEEIDMNHISKAYKKLGQNRYSDKRTSVNAMAIAIGEKYAQDGIPSLYDVFSIISENCHNSYVHAVIHEQAENEIENKVFNLQMMTLVLVKLLKFEKSREV